ncbi:hypothetical protein M5D96_012109 [Drosophila gunungcola]|uniref:Uncharacterized protein n=1 Tax=Drosophila gunungcola TaxID=103775 RepID=A0A9Q0BK41_9MUSC|nr:hypothetical protein M5D96_012109 [Drosophila gunungcola]
MWELFSARDPAEMNCGTAMRSCSVRSCFQSFLYKMDFIFKRNPKLRQPCIQKTAILFVPQTKYR